MLTCLQPATPQRLRAWLAALLPLMKITQACRLLWAMIGIMSCTTDASASPAVQLAPGCVLCRPLMPDSCHAVVHEPESAVSKQGSAQHGWDVGETGSRQASGSHYDEPAAYGDISYEEPACTDHGHSRAGYEVSAPPPLPPHHS